MSVGLRAVQLAVLMLVSGVAAASGLAGAALARDVSVRMDVLHITVTMMVYDETSTAWAEQARTDFEAMAPLVDECLQDIATRDAALAPQLAEQMRVLRDSLLGGGEFSEGILTLGYDAAQHAYFSDSAQQIELALGKFYALTADDAALEQKNPRADGAHAGDLHSGLRQPFRFLHGQFQRR